MCTDRILQPAQIVAPGLNVLCDLGRDDPYSLLMVPGSSRYANTFLLHPPYIMRKQKTNKCLKM